MSVDASIFVPLRTELNKYIINRDDEIDALFLALLSESHIFLLGQPGTGKSMLANLAHALIGGIKQFKALFTKFADDTLIFGPWSLAGLKNDQRIRAVSGRYLQDADFAFFDEAWKGTSSLLNALLEATNERTFTDDGLTKKIPLCTAILASNELPQQDHSELEAIYDRIELRMVVSPITDPADRLRLLRLPKPPANITPVLDWADVKAAQAVVRDIPITPAAEEAIVGIVTGVTRAGINVSERRLVKTLRIAQAAAFLAGDDKVEVGHLDFMVHMLWHNPEERSTVNGIVYEACAPLRKEANELADATAGLLTDLTDALALDDADPKRNQLAVAIMRKLKEAALAAVDLEKRASGRDLRAVEDTLRRIDELNDQVQREAYGLPRPASLVDLARSGKL